MIFPHLINQGKMKSDFRHQKIKYTKILKTMCRLSSQNNKSSINLVGTVDSKVLASVKNKTSQNIEGDSSLPNIAPNSTKSSSKLVKKFQSITKGEKSSSLMNLMNSSGEKVPLKNKTQKGSSIKIQSEFSLFNGNEDLDEAEIEQKMKELPHWKYGASFDQYINACTCIPDDVKKEFMKLYKNKKYFKMYQILIQNKLFKKYFDSFVIEASAEFKSPEHRDKPVKQEFEPSTTKNLELKPYYLDKDRVRSRLFGEVHSERTDVDWKNLEKLTKDAITKADLNINRLFSLKKVLENEIVRLKKQDGKFEASIQKILNQDIIDASEKDKIEKRKLISQYRSKKLELILEEVERLIKQKQEEVLPEGVQIDPKKQIFISKIDYTKSPRLKTKEGDEIVATHGHIKNLRKKDYYENRVKKNQF